ncbi:hypothetical protein [Pseudolactococcus carnosus]|uniref:Uncharacterized protein n=1 Tax=Pseudolactococcus carnosus TaxID=2749961 RepID=A0ABT0ARR8_9LACT|nr:hypothetical protein [Lactococcus carnosus]MCJ1989413.1 hypothetical protein [Lactococcus carnosus]
MKPYHSITNSIFDLENTNEWDYAALVAISCANIPFVTDDTKTTKIETTYVSVKMLLEFLKIEDDNRNRNKTKIEESIVKLGKAGIINIISTKELHNNKYFKLEQVVATSGQNQGFSSIVVEELENICFGIEKSLDKVKAIATYISIIHRIFKATKLKKEANFNSVSMLSNFICWDTLESIGSNFNKNRKSVSIYINQLENVKAIAIKSVKRKGKNKEEKLIFSKYSDVDKLEKYVQEKISEGEYIKESKRKTKVAKVKEVKSIKTVKAKSVKAKATTKKEVAEIKQEEKEQTKAQIQSMKFNGVENGDDIAGYKKQAKIFDDTAFKSAIEKARSQAQSEKQQKLLDLADFKACKDATSTTINYDKLFPF